MVITGSLPSCCKSQAERLAIQCYATCHNDEALLRSSTTRAGSRATQHRCEALALPRSSTTRAGSTTTPTLFGIWLYRDRPSSRQYQRQLQCQRNCAMRCLPDNSRYSHLMCLEAWLSETDTTRQESHKSLNRKSQRVNALSSVHASRQTAHFFIRARIHRLSITKEKKK